MYVRLYFIYCFPVEGCSLAAESSILINYLVRERLYSFIMYNSGRASSIFSTCNKLNGIIRPVTSCSNKSDTVMIQQDVTRLTTQGCSNIVIS